MRILPSRDSSLRCYTGYSTSRVVLKFRTYVYVRTILQCNNSTFCNNNSALRRDNPEDGQTMSSSPALRASGAIGNNQPERAGSIQSINLETGERVRCECESNQMVALLALIVLLRS